MKKLQTVCIIHQHPKILLGLKKRGFGAGKWNGFGGKVEEGETLEESIKRETKEESGIEIIDLEKIGILEFGFENSAHILEVHFFKSENFKGEIVESEEMKPQWFHVDEIPFGEMWPDDKHWMPLFLSGKKFKGRFLFGEADVVLEKELIEVDII